MSNLLNSILGIFSIGLLSLSSCSTSKSYIKYSSKTIKVEQVIPHLIDCFKEGTEHNGKPLYCESSAVVKVKDSVYIFNDKIINQAGLSSISRIAIPQADHIVVTDYASHPIHTQISKIESASYEPITATYIVSTAFDRIDKTSATLNQFNSIIYWQGHMNYPKIANTSSDLEPLSSVSFRPFIQAALSDQNFPHGPEYFKIEGITFIPGNRILFGVREIGNSYKDFEYTTILLEAKYTLIEKQLQILPDFKKIKTLSSDFIEDIGKSGISSIEYHNASQSLIIVFSTEDENNTDLPVQSTFCQLPIDQLHTSQPCKAILDYKGNPLSFDHKIEGLTILDDHRLFIIADEDRFLTTNPLGGEPRKPHQTIGYTLILGDE